jgi:hypothetical protein
MAIREDSQGRGRARMGNREHRPNTGAGRSGRAPCLELPGGLRKLGLPGGLRKRALLSILLTALALAASSSAASATPTYELRGEWSYIITCSCTFPGTTTNELPGTALIKEMTPSGEFKGTVSLGGLPGTIVGTETGSSMSMTLTVQAVTLTVPAGAIEEVGKAMGGSGTYNGGVPGTFAAKITRTYQEIEQEEKERKIKREEAEKERKIREAEEAKKAEEAKEAEAAKRVAEAKQAEEAKREEAKKAEEAQKAKEAAEKAAKTASVEQTDHNQGNTNPPATKLTPVKPMGRTLPVSSGGLISLELENTNGLPVTGELTLTASGGSAKSSTAPKKSTILGETSFAITAHGTKVVKIKLSRSARATLARHRTLHVAITTVTNATGQSSVSSVASVTLQSATHTRR